MALVRMQGRPTRMFDLMSSPVRDFDRLFGELANTASAAQSSYAADLYETEDKLVLEMVVPGLTAEQLDISVEDGQLIVKGSAVEENREENEERRYWLQSINRSEFSRSLKLPKRVDIEAIHADVQDGVLTLTMPKAAEAKVRKIEIGSGKSK